MFLIIQIHIKHSWRKHFLGYPRRCWIIHLTMVRDENELLARGNGQNGHSVRFFFWPQPSKGRQFMSSKKSHPKSAKYLKTTYKVRNWKLYNEAFCQRGDVTFWLSEEAIEHWSPEKTGKRGRPRLYSKLESIPIFLCDVVPYCLLFFLGPCPGPQRNLPPHFVPASM